MVDLDQIFQYCAPKYVMIRSWKLGVTKYLLMFLIFMYVVVFEILYTCSHLVPSPAQGFGTITLQHPLNNCDEFDKDCIAKFDNIKHLPYCSQNAGARKLEEEKVVSDKEEDGKDKKVVSDREEDGKDTENTDKNGKGTSSKEPKVGDDIDVQHECQYLDSRRLSWGSETPSEIFVPTHYRSIKEKRNPDCYDPFNPATKHLEQKGSQQYMCKNPWIVESEKEVFIADIESFTLHMSHSFNAPDVGLYGTSEDFQGLLAVCPTNHPKSLKGECKRMTVPNTSGKLAPEDATGLVSPKDVGITSLTGSSTGKDEISLHDLLRSTPIAQKNDMKVILDTELGSSLGHPGKSLRDVGGVLLLDVNYANEGIGRPGLPGLQGIIPVDTTIKPVTYSYRPYFVPTNSNERSQITQSGDEAQTRTIDIWYGITIKMQFNGKLVSFSWNKVLQALTTGLVLLTMATTVTTALAAFIMPLKAKYNLIMYQMSEDYSDFGHFRGHKGQAELDKMPANFVSGDKLAELIGPDGNPTKELENPDLVKLLCVTEMRLNRLDGMDPVVVFPTAEENNPINKAIGQMQKSFAEKHGTEKYELSYKARIEAKGAE